MNKIIALLAFILLLAKIPASAQVISSFKSYGHDDDPINGMSGSTSYFFRIDPLVEMNGSKMVLYFEPSRALVAQNSFINVIVADKPVYSGRLTKDSIQRIILPLSRADVSSDGKYLKVQIKTLLNISDDKCRDLDNPAMWVKIKGYSYLALNRNTKDFFSNINIANSFESKKAIVYPVNPTLHDLKAVAWAYSRMKKTDLKNIPVFEADKIPDSVRNYIMVGKINSLPAPMRSLINVTPQAKQGMFYLSKRSLNVTDSVLKLVDVNGKLVPVRSVENLTVPGEVLFITGGDDEGLEKSITALGNMNILNSTFGDYLIIDHAENTFFKTVDENRSRLTLKQIGGVTNFMSGIGALKSEYNFKNSDFSFTPKEVEISITANYSSLNANDRGFFNIYLNGMLINSEKLDASGKLKTSVTINRYQHHKYNTLVAEFRFYPSSGNCMNSFTNFFAEIDVDKSYLESKNPFITSDLSFYQYPEAFNAGSTRIVVSKQYAKYAAAAMGEVVYELNNNINANNFPIFQYSSDVNTSDIKKYNLIALLTRDDKLMGEFPDAPITFSKDFRLYNNDNNQVVYRLNDSVSNGLAQIFYGRANNATLVVTATGTHLADAFLSVSKSITEQLSTLSSNVCIADVSGNKYLFNISKSSENLEYVDTKTALSRFWESYNLYILLAILILILLSFLYVRSRVQKSQDMLSE
ncbi:cellulose biosynthesis cyclic di-GMP-binding regulatory protein BcsB [Mucilaginibacter myungsuensis]|uniref:Cellulose biosynthesis cyclic di-GMP-binding regulatory protein BcsB n=1 Tax=Mucilaginibacter myungsuensis TaxID=649104 RepID=A0A929KW28_9SPHI|nr:cellulose biosynthesis cyclic di-GMP-binding regulatory protein BcsB [Mucilaginibacter myungsuensis]MBE9660968.1 cellulose biosynthesis cyclic di-GMP-binding regulatory protein BcsB [Mucilaginibacter myungsuensis]MDN3601014.1 cellulose biosynthesis cyclic di-GMP-binding regulatory protein BcsB [Mucilaginibacter myungsuensis]